MVNVGWPAARLPRVPPQALCKLLLPSGSAQGLPGVWMLGGAPNHLAWVGKRLPAAKPQQPRSRASALGHGSGGTRGAAQKPSKPRWESGAARCQAWARAGSTTPDQKPAPFRVGKHGCAPGRARSLVPVEQRKHRSQDRLSAPAPAAPVAPRRGTALTLVRLARPASLPLQNSSFYGSANRVACLEPNWHRAWQNASAHAGPCSRLWKQKRLGEVKPRP